ncbi:ribbon-helix-helix protein, CopG family [Sandaracinobacter neustonicus]|uniref:Ribbon-helix-helix protein, CopG family n=1 Tax=Sandaracinobacter neustonicus TaxID=1715348 RepID=A0A501XDX5_9SPHN|nr:ribbon-helix-helix protein, CopG family [Sandaracinobacter neustonicus]TPE58563.1 ribbon-helix-helix protein, CopG family [Sandaracinobacter neustonicus]
MAQINVSYDDRLVAGIDRVAAARRQSRADLLRAAAQEVVEAHDAGRLAFQADDGPRIDTSLSTLVIQVRELIMELDRSQRANQRHDKRRLEEFVASEQAIQAAREHLTARINEMNRQSYQPFVEKVREVRAEVEAANDRLIEAQKPVLDQVSEQLEAVRVAATAPRVQHNLILGDDRVLSLRFLSVCAAMVGVVSTLVFLLLAGQVQPLAVPVANRLIADDEHVCRMINRRFGVDDCTMPKERRQSALRAIKAADR